MSKEIERKFLVANDGWRKGEARADFLRDGLIASVDGRKVRVRLYGARATLTIKSKQNGPTRDEFEYDIPRADAEKLIAEHCDGVVLEKTRHYVPHEGFVWEVDVYGGILIGVVLAEIELPEADTPFSLPEWVGAEVTGDPRYKKINMLAARGVGRSA